MAPTTTSTSSRVARRTRTPTAFRTKLRARAASAQAGRHGADHGRMRKRISAVLACTATALAGVAVPAQAADYYASPDGSATDSTCAQAAPCTLARALELGTSSGGGAMFMSAR